jgi:hypothetical protein
MNRNRCGKVANVWEHEPLRKGGDCLGTGFQAMCHGRDNDHGQLEICGQVLFCRLPEGGKERGEGACWRPTHKESVLHLVDFCH